MSGGADMIEELKPCPHCGGKAEYDNDDTGSEWVYCTDCRARGPSSRISSNLAIAAWNRRALPAGWMPIETAPKDGQFLVYMPDDKLSPIQVAKWHPNINIIGNHFDYDMEKPTHWQPLPAAPEAS